MDIFNCLTCGYSRGDQEVLYYYGEDYQPNESVICPSCGYQPGYTDIALGYSFQQWRHQWANSGFQWQSKYTKPENWNLKEQLQNVDVILDENNNIVHDVDDPKWHWVPSEKEL